jgi:hypothetical protein
MRTLSTLGVCGWLVAVAALPGWLSSVSDFILSYSLSSARESQIWQRLFFSVGKVQGSSPGRGDYWKPGEFDRLIGP